MFSHKKQTELGEENMIVPDFRQDTLSPTPKFDDLFPLIRLVCSCGETLWPSSSRHLLCRV